MSDVHEELTATAQAAVEGGDRNVFRFLSAVSESLFVEAGRFLALAGSHARAADVTRRGLVYRHR